MPSEYHGTPQLATYSGGETIAGQRKGLTASQYFANLVEALVIFGQKRCQSEHLCNVSLKMIG